MKTLTKKSESLSKHLLKIIDFKAAKWFFTFHTLHTFLTFQIFVPF